MTKITRTRAKANDTSLPSHDRTLVIRFRTVVGRRSLFDRSVAGRFLESSDTVELRLEFIGIPPCAGDKKCRQSAIVLKPVSIRNWFRRSNRIEECQIRDSYWLNRRHVAK